MKRSRFSEEQIIQILNEAQAGLKVQELCRKHGISNATFYKWKAKFGGLSISEARRIKGLEAENTKLKRLVAELSLDIIALKDVVSRKW
jgi:putative transposase